MDSEAEAQLKKSRQQTGARSMLIFGIGGSIIGLICYRIGVAHQHANTSAQTFGVTLLVVSFVILVASVLRLAVLRRRLRR